MGAIGTLAQYAVLVALVESRTTGALAASTFGFVAGALVNYFLNYQYTFRSRKSHRATLSRFMAVALLGLGVNSLIMTVATLVANVNYLVGQIVATGTVLLVTFVTNRTWTFREGNDESTD